MKLLQEFFRSLRSGTIWYSNCVSCKSEYSAQLRRPHVGREHRIAVEISSWGLLAATFVAHANVLRAAALLNYCRGTGAAFLFLRRKLLVIDANDCYV